MCTQQRKVRAWSEEDTSNNCQTDVQMYTTMWMVVGGGRKRMTWATKKKPNVVKFVTNSAWLIFLDDVEFATNLAWLVFCPLFTNRSGLLVGWQEANKNNMKFMAIFSPMKLFQVNLTLLILGPPAGPNEFTAQVLKIPQNQILVKNCTHNY